LGSFERFIATLIEHYAGKFPLWLAPIQISVLSITSGIKDYAIKIKDDLEKEGYRVEVDSRDETLQKKIREKELLKIPYMVIVGKKELEEGNISLRGRGMNNLGSMGIEKLLNILNKEDSNK